MCRDIGREEMKFLHLGGPGDQLRTFKHAGLVESADLDEHSSRRAVRARGEVDSAGFAEMSSGRARVIILIEGSRRGVVEADGPKTQVTCMRLRGEGSGYLPLQLNRPLRDQDHYGLGFPTLK
jgi:hypothetical protein